MNNDAGLSLGDHVNKVHTARLIRRLSGIATSCGERTTRRIPGRQAGLTAPPFFRASLVESSRRQIADDTFETTSRIDGTVELLQAVLGGRVAGRDAAGKGAVCIIPECGGNQVVGGKCLSCGTSQIPVHAGGYS